MELEKHKTIIENIKLSIGTRPDFKHLQALFSEAQYLYNDYPEHLGTALNLTKYAKSWALPMYAENQDDTFRNFYWQNTLFEAPHLFESYLQYMEKNRDPKRRFYQPRKKTLGIVVQDLQDLEDRKIKFYGLSLPARVGKLISDETPVLTDNGWKNHGDLVVGDRVVGEKGQFVKVTHIFPKNYANKRVYFADHSFIDCHENHEWLVYDRFRRKKRIVETKELSKSAYKENGKQRYRYLLPVQEPVQGEIKELAVQPYTLGAWLGDGTNLRPRITICDTDKEILQAIEQEGYSVSQKYAQINCTSYDFKKLRQDLQKVEMCYSKEKTIKHIPAAYFSASLEQRLELLAGLIDTDGTLISDEHRYQYSTTEKQLCEDVVSLINSFGWRTCVTEYEPTISTSGFVGRKKCYVIGFNPTFEIPCKVKRKQLKEFSVQKRTAIINTVDIKHKYGNCISVEGGLYRVGKSMKLTHNSTICLFFITWIMGKRPNSHNAMSGHSGILADGFYEEALNLTTTSEYCFNEIFPLARLQKKSADKNEITLDKPDRFATLTCRGIDGTWTGAVDISSDGYLYVDDLVRDRTESLSPTRLENRYQDYLNVLVDRKNDGARELMVGTRWNVIDPLGKIEAQYKNNPDYRFRKIPALNEKGESNFVYDYGLGFSTEYYINLKQRLDKNEFMAKYQQQPFVREGLLFPSDELRYYNGVLPDGDCRIISAVDVAWGGGDSLSMPIGAEYENGDVYIFDWVFNRGVKEVTLPIVEGKIIGNKIRQINFEANNGGNMYRKYIDEKLKAQNYKCSTTDTKAPGNMEKMSKIIAYSGDIKRKFIFLEEDKRSEEYQAAMDELTMFVQIGKNEHDDAPDSLAQLERFIEGGGISKVEIFQRPF